MDSDKITPTGNFARGMGATLFSKCGSWHLRWEDGTEQDLYKCAVPGPHAFSREAIVGMVAASHEMTESIYWSMLMELESAFGKGDCKDAMLKLTVEAGYRHWNRTHGTCHRPMHLKPS